MKTPEEIKSAFSNFYGSCEFVKYINSLLTEGVAWLAENAECYWLIDIITSVQLIDKVAKEPFQVFKLEVFTDGKGNRKGGGKITVEDGNNNVIYTQKIKYTDFPLTEGITLWRVDKTIMLPSEY